VIRDAGVEGGSAGGALGAATAMALTPAAPLARPRWWPGGLAWALWALAVAGLAVVAWLDRLLRQTGRPELPVLTPKALPPALGWVSAAIVGAVLASRRPRHPVGWLLLALGLTVCASGLAYGYTNYGAAHPGAAPAAGLVAAYLPTTLVMVNIWLGFVLLLTPTGTLPSPGWRWWARVTVATLVALVVVVPLAAGPAGRLVGPVASPQDLHAFDGVLLVAYQAAMAVTNLALVAAAASLVVRFRRARGVERQQLRWVALATVVLALLIMVVVVALTQGAFALAGLTGSLCLLVLPVAVGAAVLRYRLYDLDRIISRTLAYGLLTVLLGSAYAGVVLGLGRLLPQGSSLAVAAATLAVAAVFQPARRHIRQAVDRRFNRRHYDATETVEAFSARLRDQVDLDTLSAELLAVTDKTVQPTSASLWLRPQPPSRSADAAVARQRT
jgi:hypothetical protein